MSTQHPRIHPEYLADVGESARELRRFVVEVSHEVFQEEQRRCRRTAKNGAPSAAERVFARMIAPIVKVALRCRVFNGTRRFSDPDTPDVTGAQAEHWLDSYTRRAGRGRLDVDLSAAGVREDLSFWWWLARQRKNPLILVPHSELDLKSFFALTDGVKFMTFRYEVPRSAIDFANRETKRTDLLCISPEEGEDGMLFRIYASPDTASRLAQLAFEHGRRPDDERALLTTFDTCALRTEHAEAFRSNVVFDENPERQLRSALQRWTRRPIDHGDAFRALAAAEIVATLEGRPRTGDNGDDTLRDLRKWAAEQDTLDAETVDLARQVVSAIAGDRRLIKKCWRTEEARGAWQDEFHALAKRLEAATVARRARATAPNAAPRVVTRKALEDLQSPEKWSGMNFYALKADVQELLDFVREATRARFHVVLATEELHEITSSWDMSAALDAAFDGSFDDKKMTDDLSELRSGIKVLVSWPAVGPPPRVRERIPKPMDEELEEFVRELLVDNQFEELFEEPPFEVVGWGYVSFLFCGGTTHRTTTGPKRSVLRSAFEYPTGTELRRPRYAGAGPWKDVDWKELRRLVRVVREAMLRMAGARVAGSKPIPVLKNAAAAARDGWEVAGKYGWDSVKLATNGNRRLSGRKSSSGRKSKSH